MDLEEDPLAGQRSRALLLAELGRSPELAAAVSPDEVQQRRAAAQLRANGEIVARVGGQLDDLMARIRALNDGLLPVYAAARDAFDVPAVLDAGTNILATLQLIQLTPAALRQLLERYDARSLVGASPESPVQEAADLAAFESAQSRLTFVDELLPSLELRVLRAIAPISFRGEPVVEDVGPTLGGELPARLGLELARTSRMLRFVNELHGELADPAALRDESRITAARLRLGEFKDRPIDLAYLRAALSSVGLWQILDAAGGAFQSAGDVFAQAQDQAGRTGWFNDVGRYDSGLARIEIDVGGRDSLMDVYQMLMSATPEGLVAALLDLQRTGRLHTLCAGLPWRYVKELHDALPHGRADANLHDDLQPYFLVEGKWGTTLEFPEEHASLTRMIRGAAKDVGGIGGDAIEFFDDALNVATLGFHHGYGNARDAYTDGLITEGEYEDAVEHVTTRTAVGMALMMATAGVGDKLAGGAAAADSVGGAFVAGGVEAATFATTEFAAMDTFDVATGAKQDFAGLGDYAKVAGLGFAAGGAFSAATAGLTGRTAARYLPDEMKSRGQHLAEQHPEVAPVLDQVRGARRGAEVDVWLTPAQADALAAQGLIGEESARVVRGAVGAPDSGIQATVRVVDDLAEVGAARDAGPVLEVRQAQPATGGKPKILEVFVGPDLASARHLAGQHLDAQMIAAEARHAPSAEEIARFRGEGGEFLQERFAESLPPGSLEKIYVRYPLHHNQQTERVLRQQDVADEMAANPGMSTHDAREAVLARQDAEIESMRNFGPHALEKLAPGGQLDVVYYERAIGAEIEELTNRTYMDPATGMKFRLVIIDGPSSVPRSMAPNSGHGVPPSETVTRMVLSKVEVAP